jgi:hypothetical protein
MKFKNLTEEIKERMYQIYWNKEMKWDDRMKSLMDITGKSERTVRKWCVKLGFKNKIEEESEDLKIAKERELNDNKQYYIITYAQNATNVNKAFLKNIEAYANKLDAEIICIAGRYHNPTTLKKSEKAKNTDYWDPSIQKYLSLKRHDIHKTVSIMSDVKIQATAVTPLSGLEGMSKENSCIFGHPKVHMKTIPVLEGYAPKMMLTTGSITYPNYTDSKAGKKSEFHHQYGFVIVEIENDEITHIRQVTAKQSGNFYDLYFKVSNGVVQKNESIEAIVLGDLHYGNEDIDVMDSTIELLEDLTPKTVVLHDVFDGYSISHHTINDPFKQYGLEINGKNNLEDEVEYMLNKLWDFTLIDNVVVVRSNHDCHLDKFLLNDWRKLPTSKNSVTYMKYSQILLQQYASNDVVGVIPHLINEQYPTYKCLGYGDSYKVKDIELSQHGDVGTNGSRGSINQFRKLNTKIITAHTHSPARFDNAVCVGTSTKLRLSYNKGASSWLNSHAIIHKDGKIQQIHFMGTNKSYTTLES